MTTDIYTVVTELDWVGLSRPELQIHDRIATLHIGGKFADEIAGRDREELAHLLEGWAEIFAAAAKIAKGPATWRIK